jgi:simple sugar transport system permease protein
VLSDIPIVGPQRFRQPALTYVGLALVLAMFVLLHRTRAGLTLRAVGENPVAAFAGGADPIRVRTLAVVCGGGLAGIGGAILSLQQVGTVTDAMTNGRGYLALAAIIVGRWSPAVALVGCLLFDATDALRPRIQGLRVPVSSYVIQTLPYVVSLAVLAGLGRGAKLPAAIGTPFLRR